MTVEKKNGEQTPQLKSEGPLSEKDQQGQAIEHQQKLAEKALEAWRRLKERVKQFKSKHHVVL